MGAAGAEAADSFPVRSSRRRASEKVHAARDCQRHAIRGQDGVPRAAVAEELSSVEERT